MSHFMEDFSQKIRDLYSGTLEPVAGQFVFQRPPTIGELKRPPLVLLLGNHSSGKSTFINYLLGADVQNTGVAPTDDDFTIITHGTVEDDRDGPSIVSNPDLPYKGLRNFGDTLVSHVRLKLRDADLLRDVTLIDSPGMIDEAKAESGRGYDFPGVVRWFAERADLVLMFFDPDKPGTTGETLQVLNQSLSGIDHKLLIVMNKMDQFRTMHDYGRASGALSWNLGKVIPRKDLPLIYHTYVPLKDKPAPVLPMEDFEKARNNLMAELKRAPARRLDNMITQLHSYAERLRLHAFVIDKAVRDIRRRQFIVWFGLAITVFGLGALAVFSGLVMAIPALVAGAAVLASLFEFWLLPRARKRRIERFEETFETIYGVELLVRDQTEDLQILWNQVEPRARAVATKRGLKSFKPLREQDRVHLNRLIEEDVPRLRGELHERLSKEKVVRPVDTGREAAPYTVASNDLSLPSRKRSA